MQGTRMRFWIGGGLLAIISATLQAETLQPDPAWQEGKLDNGFSWQVLATPQRPGDRIELRLRVNTGSLVENTQQSGFSHLLPRLAMVHNAALDASQQRALWQQAMAPGHSMPPAVTSYDYTQYNLSLPNNRPELIKDALAWLAATAGGMSISEPVVSTALQAHDPGATWPTDTQDAWWRYRLKGSALLAHDPAEQPHTPVDLQQLQRFYQQWYTPDAMTLYVVGNVESRTLSEQINKAFSSLTGKREAPSPVATLSPLPHQPINLVNRRMSQDRLMLVWDTPWQPIRDSRFLARYWQSDLAREALFWHVQSALSESKTEGVQLGFDCRVFYQRAQCAINMDSDGKRLDKNMLLIAKELAKVRDKGLSQEAYNTLLTQKRQELGRLFTTYARMDTNVLISQRLRSQQNMVVDIAPEQYKQLREAFLNALTPESLNQELNQQLAQELTMVLVQPEGEAETNVKLLHASWNKIMALPPSALPVSEGDAAESGAEPASNAP